MKKIFTFFAAAALAMSAFATDYTGNITVKINGEGNAQETTINIVQNEDETYKLSINNFTLDNNGSPMGVGNIVLDNMKGYTINGVTTVVADQSITITEGDDPNIAFWVFLLLLGFIPSYYLAMLIFTSLAIIGTTCEGDGEVTAGDITAVYNILLNN